MVVPTVDLGFLDVVFCSIATTGDKPSIFSTSGLFKSPMNCRAYTENVSMYLLWASEYIVSKANDDFPLPETPVITTSLFRGISKSIFFKL